MANNDEGRKVSGKRYTNYHGTPCTEEFTGARFIMWGSDFAETENGSGSYTVAIVELEGGQVVAARPEFIKFEPQKWEE